MSYPLTRPTSVFTEADQVFVTVSPLVAFSRSGVFPQLVSFLGARARITLEVEDQVASLVSQFPDVEGVVTWARAHPENAVMLSPWAVGHADRLVDQASGLAVGSIRTVCSTVAAAEEAQWRYRGLVVTCIDGSPSRTLAIKRDVPAWSTKRLVLEMVATGCLSAQQGAEVWALVDLGGPPSIDEYRTILPAWGVDPSSVVTPPERRVPMQPLQDADLVVADALPLIQVTHWGIFADVITYLGRRVAVSASVASRLQSTASTDPAVAECVEWLSYDPERVQLPNREVVWQVNAAGRDLRSRFFGSVLWEETVASVAVAVQEREAGGEVIFLGNFPQQGQLARAAGIRARNSANLVAELVAHGAVSASAGRAMWQQVFADRPEYWGRFDAEVAAIAITPVPPDGPAEQLSLS